MNRQNARLLPLLLFPLLATTSGCMTSRMLSDVSTVAQRQDTVALRVQKCYLSPGRDLVVLAVGGRYIDPGRVGDTPRGPVWFEVNFADLARTAQNGVVILPLSSLQSGTPDTAGLIQRGFVEISFKEAEVPISTDGRIAHEFPAGQSNLSIEYARMITTNNFPEGLGFAPWFYPSDSTATPRMPFCIEHDYTTHPDGNILYLPMTLTLDAVTLPFQFLSFVINGHWPSVWRVG